MCSLFRILSIAIICAAVSGADTNKLVLRIAADPNNLPFSNEQLEGFENRIADLIARELGADVQYSWREQRSGGFRETVKANEAELVTGGPGDVGGRRPTK